MLGVTQMCLNWVSVLINRWDVIFANCVGVHVYELTLLGWACMDKAVLTERTLKRKGSCPWKVSLTFEPRQPGKWAIHSPSVFCAILLSLIWASPLGWAPIHSWNREQRKHYVHPISKRLETTWKVIWAEKLNSRKPFALPQVFVSRSLQWSTLFSSNLLGCGIM